MADLEAQANRASFKRFLILLAAGFLLPVFFVCASSGAAAVLNGGCTLHSAIGIGIDNKHRKPTQNQIAAWSEVSILIIDEFSMVKPSVYSVANTRVCDLKDRLNLPFGGIHVVFCGDFYQLPPVGSVIYQTPTSHENDKDRDAN